MSSVGGGENFISSGTNQLGVTPRSPLTTGLKRLHSESSGLSPPSKLPRRGSTSGASGDETSNRERLLQLISTDVWKLHSRHRRHLAELLYIQHNGFYLDFESWLNSSPPQLVAYLQAHSFDISEILSGRSSASSATPPSPSVWIATESDRHAVVSQPSDSKSPIRIGFATGTEISSGRLSEERGQHSVLVATPSTVGPTTVSAAAADSTLLLETSASSSVLNAGVLPVITIPSPSPFPFTAPTATTTSSPIASAKSILEAHLAAKHSPGPGRPPGSQGPTHRGPGRPPGKKNAANIVNGTRYRPAPVTDGRIEHAAKQEVAVMQRIADLRREGLWSADKLPRCADPPRSKAHWDYLLEEMKWLASDFEQERKFKKQLARKLVAVVVRQKKDEEEKQKRVELDREKELKRVASFAAKEIRQFWNNVEKVVEYKVDSIMEAKRKRALDKHLDFIVGQTEKFSSLVQEGLVRPSTSSVPASEAANEERGDSDFEMEESSEDDESTIDKEEKQIVKEDVDEEVALLQEECDLDLDDILDSLPPGYLEARASSEPGPSHSADAANDENESTSSDESDNEHGSQMSSSQPEELPEDVDFAKLRSDNSDVRQQELTHFAETAEKLQPKGYTLETATVVTKVPFLLKHQLREYQHVGLDWLVTLYERKLNGILADEMGLGKTIQTIALLAHLACEKGNWGPHLIVVPTTVMLNWEMEFKKWCPAFKILTYYGSVKERKEKRQGWSKPNAFHVCITSYKLVLQDHLVFRRKKWEYLILDEAQNIKNFKSQRWQMLLHFNAQRRLLLTGTPLQNSLMELWSLMHFLMPEIFASHRDFKDWFSNPVTDMIEGSREFNEQTVRRLHKVLRPFLLRRLKSEVEKQLPKKYEHPVSCHLSKRQRYLYDDFMSRASTKDQLSTGNVMSVLNILMQLRKVCNHPNLFESRPITSPFIMERLMIAFPTLVNRMARNVQTDHRVPCFLLLQRCRRDVCIRCKQLAPDRRLIEELSEDSSSDILQPPAVPGFKFVPLKAPITTSISKSADAATKKKNFQFVIPPSVAKDLDFSQPFLVQIEAEPPLVGSKLVPIQLRPPPADALAKIGLRVPSPAAPATPGPSNAPIQLPVWRLSKPSAHSAATLQSPLAGIRATANRLAIVSRPMGSEGGSRPGFAVTLVRQPLAPVRFGKETTDSVIRSRTVLFRPAVPHAGSGVTVLRPQITVQDLRTRTPPTVRYVDPSRGISSLPSSKASTPVASPAVIPSSPNVFATAASLLPSPGDSAGSEVDLSERMLDSSPKSIESSEKPAASGMATIGSKRSASSETGLEPVAKRRSMEHRQQVLQLLATANERRNLSEPLYGCELAEIFSIVRQDSVVALRGTHMDMSEELAPLIARFGMYTPGAISGLPRSTCSSEAVVSDLESIWPELNAPFKTVIDSQMMQFPEIRLIEYDCGKLQVLNGLLRRLKDEGHRCLIFTQMTRILDILETFLSHLGLKYLRLDGATRIEHRQVLMERFNQDSRIFCMILSTRSGGLGVNLTGANTVIFYDSDWNPTMDAQAQDRCHRIGQTRDVHIYRLISEKTIEENILKKATQKRRLGEVAIEEGSFTTEFFKKGNLKDIFDIPDDVAVRDEPALSQQELEQQMAALEDESDVQAARSARAETMAELSEFDEAQAAGGDEDADPDVIEVEHKMRQLMSELKPVERYAVKYLETLYEPDRLDELQHTEERMEQRKQQWELANRERMDKEEGQRRREEEEEFDLTYGYEDSLAQMFCPAEPMEPMPIWMPPTPPMSDTEFEPYMDQALGYLYNLDPMEEGDLPPIVGELDLFRMPAKVEQAIPAQPSTPITRPPSTSISDIPAAVAETVANIRNSFNKTPKEGQPRSLFEGGPATYRPKRDVRRPLTPPSPTFAEPETTDFPEWGVLEDYALLQAVTKGQQMAYTLASGHPGHVANWDYVSKWVSSIVGHYCSPRACHNRYQYVILPREEGRVVTIDALSKKARKSMPNQEIGNVKKFRMRTGQQFQHEGSSFMATKLEQRFISVRKATLKRVSSSRERGLGLANCLPATVITRRRHDVHLQSLGYSADKILTPGQLADMREERLKEMKKQHQLQQQQQPVVSFHNQQPTPVQISFQSPPMQQPHTPMQPVHSLPQYPQATPQSQSLMDSPHPLTARATAPVSGNYGIASTPGAVHQQPIQVSLQQPVQSQMDGSQIAVSIHPASRLMIGTHPGRQNVATIVSSAGMSGGTSITHMLASGSPRPQGVGVTGMGARAGMAATAGVTTATVYRQVGTTGGLLRAQRTPPSTPGPSGLHPGTSVQLTPGPMHQRTQGIESGATPVIGPVALQTAPQTIRFQPRPKLQSSGSGGFLVAADVNKPMIPLQMTSTTHASGTSHQTVTPISITAANAARVTANAPRHHVQLSQTSISATGKKNLALPRIATFTHASSRAASPVHFVASQVGNRLTTQTMHGVRAPSPSQILRASGTSAAGGRNIPSINMIMPPVGRLETIQGTAGVSVSTTPVSTSQGHLIVTTTSVTMISPQTAPASTQGFGTAANRGLQ